MTPADRNRLLEEIAVAMYAHRWRSSPFCATLDEATPRDQAEYRAMADIALAICEKKFAPPKPVAVAVEEPEEEIDVDADLTVQDVLVKHDEEIDGPVEDIPF